MIRLYGRNNWARAVSYWNLCFNYNIVKKKKENNYWNLTYNMPKTFGDRWMIIPNMLLSWDVKIWNAAAVTNALRIISDINQLNFPNLKIDKIICQSPVAKQSEVAYAILSCIWWLLTVILLLFWTKIGNWKVLSDELLYVISFLWWYENNG